MKFVVVCSALVSLSIACKTIKNEGSVHRVLNVMQQTRTERSPFSYDVLILAHGDDDIFRCGGAVIANRWVLTAAHCIDMAWAAKVFLGLWFPGVPGEPIGNSFLALENDIIVHGEWDRVQMLNDIALIKSPQQIVFNDYVQAINLPKKSHSYPTYECEISIASGWEDIGGSKCENDTTHMYILRWTDAVIQDSCAPFLNALSSTNKGHLCVETWKGDKSICEAYLGGPLVRADDSRTLVGIASFLKSENCDPDTTIIYTRITSYLDWIAEKSGVVNV